MPTETTIVACPACATLNRVPSAKLGDGGTCGHCRSRLFEGRPIALDAAAFAKHAGADLPLLVDFWASWCGPCRAFAPIFEQAAEALEPRVRLGKVDADADADLASRYRIRTIPSLLLIHRGREIGQTSGALPLHDLIAWTELHLPRPAA